MSESMPQPLDWQAPWLNVLQSTCHRSPGSGLWKPASAVSKARVHHTQTKLKMGKHSCIHGAHHPKDCNNWVTIKTYNSQQMTFLTSSNLRTYCAFLRNRSATSCSASFWAASNVSFKKIALITFARWWDQAFEIIQIHDLTGKQHRQHSRL